MLLVWIETKIAKRTNYKDQPHHVQGHVQHKRYLQLQHPSPNLDKKRETPETRQQPNTDRDNKRQCYSQRRQSNDKTINHDLDDQMHLPDNLKFGDIFKFVNTGEHPPLKHADGAARWHNYHHRGFCWPTYTYKSSHSCILTAKQKSDGRKYLQTLLGKYNAARNKKYPILPNGHPPLADVIKSSENDSGT